MSLLDEASALAGKSASSSKILRLVDKLDGKARDEVVDLIWDHPELPSRAVAEVLTRHYEALVGEITLQQVTSHRKKPRP